MFDSNDHLAQGVTLNDMTLILNRELVVLEHLESFFLLALEKANVHHVLSFNINLTASFKLVQVFED